MRIVVVSDRACMRRALLDQFRDEPLIAVAGQAATGDEAVATARLCHAGAVVVDAGMTLEGSDSVLARLTERGFCGQVLLVDRARHGGDEKGTLRGSAQEALPHGPPLAARTYCLDSESEQLIEQLRAIALDLRLPRGLAHLPPASRAA